MARSKKRNLAVEQSSNEGNLTFYYEQVPTTETAEAVEVNLVYRLARSKKRNLAVEQSSNEGNLTFYYEQVPTTETAEAVEVNLRRVK